jgi:hypothetical protein
MTKLKFTDYAHDSYEDSETIERLTEEFDWSEEDAQAYVSLHRPLYEVEATLEYDTETQELRVLEAVIDNVTLRPDDD